jgi:endonuclease YncB( thermonuclease family)
VWSGIAAGVFVVVATTDLASAGSPGAGAAAPGPASSAAAPPAPAPPALSAGAGTQQVSTGDQLAVTRVIDGDTFEVAGGRSVQVLGIDACEAGTSGGDRATEAARDQLEGHTVTLTREPGVDSDRHGHDLRYVAFSWGGDFGESAVGYDHTTAYDGHGASARYLAGLRDRDDGPLDCAQPVPPTSVGSDEEYDADYDADVILPRPGDQGLPDGALTGGYCAKKWWC